MIRVNNKKAIKNLAKKSFRAVRSRNIIAIIAIALTSLLFTSIFTVGIGMVESLQNETMRQAGSTAHGSFKNLTQKQYDELSKHPSIDEISVNILCAESVKNPEFLKRHMELWYNNENALKWSFNKLSAGRMPETPDEIAMDAKSLNLLNVPAEIGQKVTLSLEVKPGAVPAAREFTLSGIIDPNDSLNVGFGLVSKAYLHQYSDELQYSYDKDYSASGAIRADVKFANTYDIEDKLQKIISETGYSNDENAPNYISSNPNWAYIGSQGTDVSGIIAIASGCLLIMLTGYLIIYNIFQISITRDIRFYGLLKTIGTTRKQIQSIILRQAMTLCLFGIPIGLIIGFLTGRVLVPMMVDLSSAEGSAVVSANPVIFIFSALFALATVFLSTRKPSRLAAKVSPVEAVRYSGASTVKAKVKTKKSLDGGKIHKMAFSNLTRNKKRTAVTVFSLALSLVLLNTVFTLSNGFDMDKYLKKFVDTDFLMAHSDYFNYNYTGTETSLSKSLISAVEKKTEFSAGGRIYSNFRDTDFFTAEDFKNKKEENKDSQGNYFASLYGMEDFPLSRMQLLEGKVDPDKLATGDYILAGVSLDDNGKPVWETCHYNIGDQVTLHNNKGAGSGGEDGEYTTRTFTVMAKVAINYYANSTRINNDYTFYLPASIYRPMVAVPGLMSYVYNVEDGRESAMEAFLKDYTENTEPTMHYESKQIYVDQFADMQRLLLTAGGLLCGIIGLIGILNFFNSILTGILTRKTEFATLQSIGMTRRQLIVMLTLEGGYYALLTAILSLVLGIAVSFGVVGMVVSKLWFFSYQFTLLPLLAAFPALLFLSLAIPPATYKGTGKMSIVEQLREVE